MTQSTSDEQRTLSTRLKSNQRYRESSEREESERASKHHCTVSHSDGVRLQGEKQGTEQHSNPQAQHYSLPSSHTTAATTKVTADAAQKDEVDIRTTHFATHVECV